MSEQAHKEREHFFAAAKLMAGMTLLSRVLGMLRDMAIASLGANRATAAFVMAFQIPNLFRRLFGEGALSGSFVPIFTETVERDGAEKASRLFANALALMSLVLTGLLVLTYVGLVVWHVFWPGEWDRQLVVGLTSVTMPFMVTMCLLSLCSSVMNCQGQFAYPTFAPILLNLFVIAAAWGVAPALHSIEAKLYVISAAVTLSGVAQLAGGLWLLRRDGVSIRPRLRPVEPGIGPMARLMAPMIIGLGFLQVSPFFDSILIWYLTYMEHDPTISLLGWQATKPLTEAAQMQVFAAQRLYQFPMGVLAISLGVAIFPLLSRYAARRDLPNLRACLNRAVRLSMLEGLAAGTGLFLLAEPIMKLIYVHGKYTAADAAGSASILQMYVLGMWSYCTFQIFSRAFFALKEPRTPLVVSCVLVVANVLLVAGLVWVPALGAGAFGLATSLTSSANVVILAVMLRRRVGLFGGRKLAFSTLRSAAACAAMAAVVYPLRVRLEHAGAASWIVVLACMAAGAATLLAASWLMRAPELGELLGAARRKPADDAPPAA